ncbi:MAG: MoxR family ATPase [Clostridia bacterium]|nr:MoxR family ATPase [Clostridia bacterium]
MDNKGAVAVINEVRKSVIGKDVCVIKVMAAILAGGHILIEDIPGVGKTTMANAFSKAMEMSQHRVQFTPDVMPADITGFTMYDAASGKFVYREGAAMCNLFLADEINRTSPKTQSALLQVMEESKVTVDGEDHLVPDPFVVIATQNPIGSAGTQRLPMSQLDRFMICISMGYPDIQDEIEIVKGKVQPRENVTVISQNELLRMKAEVNGMFIHDALYQYIGRLIQATRESDLLDLGVSPRGTIAFTRMCKAMAYLKGRDYVLPDDIAGIFPDCIAHRLVLSKKARISGITADEICQNILAQVKKPVLTKKN